VIRFHHVTFYFSHHRYLFHDLHGTIPGQGITWVSGPSGRGKSTLFSLIRHRNFPQDGTIVVKGKRWLHLHHPIDWTPHATVGYYLAFFNLHSSVLNRLFLNHIPLHQHVMHLSGGEQTRFFLTLLLSQEADGFLLDEPCSGLDEASRMAVKTWILEVSQTKPVMIASHLSLWREAASLHLELQEEGMVEWHALSHSPNTKRHPLSKRVKKVKVPPIKIKKRAWHWLAISMLQLGFIGNWLFQHGVMLHQATIPILQNQTWMGSIEEVVTVPLENSPYTLVQTRVPNLEMIRLLFLGKPTHFIHYDLRGLLPNRLISDQTEYQIAWVQHGHNESYVIADVYGPPFKSPFLWTFEVTWYDNTTAYTWTIQTEIVMRHVYRIRSPWQSPMVFLPYEWFHQWIQQHLWLSPKRSLLSSIDNLDSSWPLTLNVPYATFDHLNYVLKDHHLRIRVPFLEQLSQQHEVEMTLLLWRDVLLIMLGMVWFSWMHFTHKRILTQLRKPILHWRALGIPSTSLIQALIWQLHPIVWGLSLSAMGFVLILFQGMVVESLPLWLLEGWLLYGGIVFGSWFISYGYWRPSIFDRL